MAVNNPTIIVGHLNDKELKDSIDQLVQHVDKGTQTMVESFNKSIDAMKQKLAELGKEKLDLGVTMPKTDTTRRKKESDEETKSVKETTFAYDQLAQAKQKASQQPPTAQDSYHAFIKNMRESVAGLAIEIKSMQNLTLEKQIIEHNKYQQEINSTKQKISELRAQLNEVGKNPSSTRFDVNAITSQIETYKNKIHELETEQIKAVQRISNADREAIAQKQAQYEKERQELIALSVGERERVTFTQSTTKELEKQLQQIKEINSAKGAKDMFGTLSTMPMDNIDQVRHKIELLQALVTKLRSTPLLSNANMKKLEDSLYAAKVQLEAFERQARGTNVSKESIEALNNAIRQNVTEEQKRKDAIVQTGLEAQKTLDATIAKLHEQASIAGNTPLTGTKELIEAFRQMNSAYYSLSQGERESAVGLALEKDIKRARTAIAIVREYNNAVFARQQENSFKVTESDSLNVLRKRLSLLTNQFNNLKMAEITAGKGDDLIRHFQETSRAAQKMQQVLSRPLNIDAIRGLSERTLDDVAYKMQMISNYRSGLDIKAQSGEISELNRMYNDLQKKQQETIGSNKKFEESNNALTRSFNYMKNRLAFYFTVGASTQFVKTIYDIRSQYELLERSIGILVDSAQQGTQIFSELNAMAIKSPFTTMELGAAAKQLVAYDVEAKDVVETTKRLGDIAAAAGIPMERLTYSLGHIKAFGYLNARDARMWANAGIPLVKNLADRYTELEGRLVSVSDVYDRIKKKSVGFEDVLDVINSMTDEGGKFFNFQERAADTMKVRLANLTLAYNNMLNEMGKSHQTLLTQPLILLKNLYENWRKVDNVLITTLSLLGLLKTAQIAILILQGKIADRLAWEAVLGKKLTSMFITLGKSTWMLLTNWMTWTTAVVGAFIYLGWTLKDIANANEELNKSISDNAQENIDSINKFFEDYKKQLESIENASLVEQNKMWERVQDEIEKSTKNAKDYLDVLDNISSLSERIRVGERLLSQTQEIEKEIKRLASQGSFNIGGGFANDTAAEDLIEVDKRARTLIQQFKTFGDAEAKLTKSTYANVLTELRAAQREAVNETESMISSLDRIDLNKVLTGGDKNEDLAHLREVALIWRDNFLSTEKGQKISTEGLSVINQVLDSWITKQAQANGLIDENRAKIESNRTAWENFFSGLSQSERQTLDYLIETGQTTTDEFKDIWDKASENMKESSYLAYASIQDQIAKLRETPDIVINVVYRQEEKALNDQQKRFKERWLTPQGETIKTADNYFQESKELNEKYGRFMIKQDEDNVEWEKRLGETYRDNDEKIKSLNKQLENRSELNKVDREQKEHELKLLNDEQGVLREIRDDQNFNYEKEKKGKNAQKKAEDEVANALQKEIQLINEMRGNYDKLRKSGVSNMEAIDLASQGYEDTILRINNILGKYGINKFNASNFTGKDVRTLLNNLESQRKTLLASGKVKLASLQSLDVEIKKLSVDAKTYDMKKITEGLNNELGKLKEEYELAVELEANPELGDMFTDMLGVDVSGLPRTFEQVFGRANEIAKRELEKLGVDIQDFDILSTIIKGDENNRWMGLDMESEPIKELLKQQKTYRDMFKKNLIDTEKDLDDYVKKYGGYADKVAEIESNRLERLARLNNAYYTEEMRKHPEYLAKLRAINEGARRETAQVDFDEFKNSRYYTMMFENLEYVSTRSINAMRDKLLGLMDTMHELTPEQLKTVMQQYEKLEQTLVKRNPFRTLAKDVRNYFKTYGERRIANNAFKIAQEEYDAQKEIVAQLKVKKEQAIRNKNVSQEEIKTIDEEIIKQEEELEILHNQLDATEKIADKHNMIKKLVSEEAQQAVQMVNANIQSLGQLRDFIQDDLGVALGDELNGFADGMTKASEGLNNIISSAQSGNVVGTALGIGQAVAGVFDGVASIFGDGAARTKRLNREIAKSEEAVRQLNMAYKELERTVDSAMGAEELRARRSEIANKRAQLAELERQMALEREKRSKDRDDEKIKQYEESIQDLRYEIEDLVDDIAGTLLGGGVKDAAESFVDTWVSAWREGGDTMDALKQKFDDMIDTMIAKSLASRLVAKRIQHIWDAVDMATNEESEGGAEITLNELQRLRELVGDKSIAERINEDLTNLYNALGIAYGVDSDTNKNLSNLQQGIQGITEDTAGAIEAYMNSVSQQVYLQSDLMMQIRDAVVGLDIDIQTATISQMLLQLQQSYAIQVAIQNTLNGALNPSGRAFMVELNS